MVARNSRNAQADADTPICYSGKLAAGVSIKFSFDPETAKVSWRLDGAIRGALRGQPLRRYRRIRHEFLERVAGMLDASVAVVEIDESGHPDGLFRVGKPQAGLA